MRGSNRTIDKIEYYRRIRDVSIAFAGILLFALFIHQPVPRKVVAFIALSISAANMGYSLRYDSLPGTFGLTPVSRRIFLSLLPAVGLGVGLGWLTRYTFDLTSFPKSLGPFVLIAPCIGATEELIFRGYIQGYLRPAGRTFSVVYAAAAHTSYKLLLILSLKSPLQFNFFFLVAWTFLGGLAFGALREGSKSIIPAMIAHAIFDVVLYGGYVMAPLWVWS